MAKKQVGSNKSEKKSTVSHVQVNSGSSAKPWMYYLIAMVITALCHWPSVSNELVNWDDDPNITENVNLARIGQDQPWGETVSNIFDLEKGNVIGNYNPLPILTFAMEKSMTGGKFDKAFVRQIHLDNVLLHLFVVFFAMRVLMLLGLSPIGALIGGLLMGIHPMRVESVAWATERKDVLFGLFFFASLAAYIRYVKTEGSNRKWWFILSMVLAVFSLFSKVQAVTLVVSMVLVDYLLRRAWSIPMLVEKLPLLAASVAMGLANIHTLAVQGSTNDDITGFNFFDRICIATWSFTVYLYKLFIPYPMSPLYPYPKPIPWFIYVSPVVFIAAFYWAYRQWKSDRREWLFGFLFFFLNVAPVLQLLGAGQGYLADRFTYVPYFGFFAIAAWLYDHYSTDPSRKTLVMGTAGVALLAFAMLTVQQIKVWKNGETLWSHVMKYEYDAENKRYTNSLPFWNRGQYFRKKNMYEKSLADYTMAVNIDPKNPELYNSRGKTYFDLASGAGGKLTQQKMAEYTQLALKDYNMAAELPNVKNKSLAEILINRGAAHGLSGDFNKALADMNNGLIMDPTNKNGYFNRSIAHMNTNQIEKAIEDYTSYLKYDPFNANITYERGMAYRIMKRYPEAIADLSNAIRMKPDFGLAYLERARSYGLSGNKAAAQADYQQAQRHGNAMVDFDRNLLAQ